MRQSPDPSSRFTKAAPAAGRGDARQVRETAADGPTRRGDVGRPRAPDDPFRVSLESVEEFLDGVVFT